MVPADLAATGKEHMRILKLLAFALVGASLAGVAAKAQDLENTLYMDLDHGRVVIELLPELAPLHVERIKELTRAGFYDGVVFHRVIEGFMAQSGDPTGTGRGGSDLPDLPAEFTDTPYERGTLGMARTNDPDTANSQFFITFNDQYDSSLRGNYTVFGRVVSGMEFVDQIEKGEPPANPDEIIRLSVAADVE